MISIPNHITKGAFRKVKCVCLPKDGTQNYPYIFNYTSHIAYYMYTRLEISIKDFRFCIII